MIPKQEKRRKMIDGDALLLKIHELQQKLSSNDDKTWNKNKPAYKAMAYVNSIIIEMQKEKIDNAPADYIRGYQDGIEWCNSNLRKLFERHKREEKQ